MGRRSHRHYEGGSLSHAGLTTESATGNHQNPQMAGTATYPFCSCRLRPIGGRRKRIRHKSLASA
ncbi:MAG: hypothetical protein BJ554DRAFT_6109 [Olpidium bornovanus]|uniref:Uncharacterized protein n=1 Tax=Olpidium bornovanus TaxID=278681 RepID=A0A8H8DMJ0_9FUNG|nr:MAG: hypothetical protein BJ554DRAFT_6109 [Olpidium bornovanus]